MSNMPARKPAGSDTPLWVQTARLTLPLPDARAQLEELISEGSGLAVEVSKAMDAEEFTGRVDEWHRRTSQWLNKNIGGQAAYDYKVAVESAKVHVWSRSLWEQYRVARKRDIEYEVRVLRSIERRLPDWVPPSASSSAEVGQRPARVTPRVKKSGKAVMVVYGHDEEAKVALFKWLRMIGLQPKEWTQLVKESDSPISYVGQVVKRAFDSVQAVVRSCREQEDLRSLLGNKRPLVQRVPVRRQVRGRRRPPRQVPGRRLRAALRQASRD